MKNKNKAKVNNKALFILLIFLGVFALFIFLITRPSEQSKAINELPTSMNIQEVKNNWDKHKEKLYNNDDYIEALRARLSSFNLIDSQVIEVKNWLPKPPTSLNLILVPDLSRRLIDNFNNPEQVKNDTILINFVWNVFVDAVKLKMDSKDRLLLDVTDAGQAEDKFRNFANDLIFDLSTHKNQSNRLYFEKQSSKFRDKVDSLYQLAIKKPLGADYWYYFDRNLNKLIQKNTLFDDYRNILIIITDGYLEAEHKLYTGNEALHNSMCREIHAGKGVNQVIAERGLKITPCDVDLSNLEILILEVNERQNGIGCHFDILKKLWADWLKGMKVKNIETDFFIQRNDATDLTKKSIENFIKK